MRFFVTAVAVFAATSLALPLGSVIPPGAKEYILSVTSADGSIKGNLSSKNGRLGVFPNLPPAKFFTTTYEPAQTLAFHIGDISNQIILVGSNGLLDIDDLANPSADTIPKGKLAEWSTFTIAANGTLGVKDGADIPSRRWIAYPLSDGYVISLYDGYTKNDAKMTTVQVAATSVGSAPAAPAPAPPAPAPPAPAPPAPAPPAPETPIVAQAPQRPSPQPAQPRPQQSSRPQPIPRPAQPGSPYPRVNGPSSQQPPNGSPYPRVQPSLGPLQPYAPTFGGGSLTPGGFVPYNANAAPSWQSPPAPAAPLPVQDPNAPLLYPSADGPASSSGPSPSAGGAPPTATVPLASPSPAAGSAPWWDPFGLFSGSKPADAAATASPTVSSPAAPDYQPAAGVSGPAPTPSPSASPSLFNGISSGLSQIGSLLGLGPDTDVPEASDDNSNSNGLF